MSRGLSIAWFLSLQPWSAIILFLVGYSADFYLKCLVCYGITSTISTDLFRLCCLPLPFEFWYLFLFLEMDLLLTETLELFCLDNLRVLWVADLWSLITSL